MRARLSRHALECLETLCAPQRGDTMHVSYEPLIEVLSVLQLEEGVLHYKESTSAAQGATSSLRYVRVRRTTTYRGRGVRQRV